MGLMEKTSGVIIFRKGEGFMWDNIGGKLKGLAKVVCWLGIIGSVVAAIATWTQGSRYVNTFLPGLLYLLIGGCGSWVSSWTLYGLGLVVEYVESKHAVSATGNSSSSEQGNGWVCSNCKTWNPKSKGTCKTCGLNRNIIY